MLDIRDRDVTLASAFGVSRLEVDLLRELANRNQKVVFIVGTQGGFTSPDFIKAGRELALELPNLEFIVDFQLGDSIHHKWALASPDTVLLGSSNFTRKGLDGTCDLMGTVADKVLYRSIQADLARVRNLKGVFAADDPRFVAAQKAYELRANRLQDIELQKIAAGIKRNPYKVNLQLPSLAEWLDSDDAQSLRIFGYERPLNKKEISVDAGVRKAAEEQSLPLGGVASYCPDRAFGGPFLDVNGITKARQSIHPAQVLTSGKSRGVTVVLARRVPWRDFGFRMTPAEVKLIAAIAVEKSEGRLSVSEMRAALKPLAAARKR
ncbi:MULTISPECIES: phospholipase D-like domain-containing protein [Rhodanobacter]|uniref:phospholipase D-like domain-containing protein n=1 Tax=Rhodanobacter TaxID=75309 RepID=UPI00047FAFE8|nr:MULTISPECIES: phospholipase D-like domain-containing protein [Rhodanobacter]KZC19729.1 hypothetical protein RHOFW104R3_29560 [Rhodanobacter denitrificans]UJJ52662.1 phospholipase D-like domain-containing protein [Rhodanobacter denitrificans]UJM95415.1 phospholipase D-like domain-containing protein [Rhodanobacter denitrificans]UJM98946.1 phospholipase D-like domain-containing protein [Rhodanobacter denitrificans]UJN21639.1 phospholipase D-like domain-containing protein [Rhodanobacter denitri